MGRIVVVTDEDRREFHLRLKRDPGSE